MARSLRVGHHAETEDSVADPVYKKSVFRGLKLFVKDLDLNTLPPFLARLCDPDKPCKYSEEEILCIFETAAEVHGRNILPHISQIISTIIRTMSSVPGPLHSVDCSKVICTLSRYVIDPLATEEEKSGIISSLCCPLSDCLMNTKESMSSGSALCVTALAQSNNWQFASSELVNDICLKVSGALEEAHCQTVAHLSLVVALSKKNPLSLEPYGRSLIRSGLQILEESTKANNSHMIIPSIQMIHSIMKSLDLGIISSEISSIIHALEQFQEGCTPDISTAAFEAAETAKNSGMKEECEYDKKLALLANYSGRHSRKGLYSHSVTDDADIRDSGSNESPSCDVQSVRLFTDYDSQPSVGRYSGLPGSARARRRLWSNGSDKSRRLSNGDFFHTPIPGSHDALGVIAQSNSAGLVKSVRRCSDVPTRMADPCHMCLTCQAANQCSQLSRRQALSGDIRMQSTPRKQLHSCTFCSESGRDSRQLPESPALRQIRRCSGQCTDGLLFEKNGEAEEREGYWDTVQRNNQCHVQDTGFLIEDLKFPHNGEHSDSAGIYPCEECQAENGKAIGGKKRNANYSGASIFLFVCVVIIIALLLAWRKEGPKELYVVPT